MLGKLDPCVFLTNKNKRKILRYLRMGGVRISRCIREWNSETVINGHHNVKLLPLII